MLIGQLKRLSCSITMSKITKRKRGDMFESRVLADSWAKFLDNGWDIFVTITFRRATPCFPSSNGYPGAIREFKHFFKHLNSYPNEFFSKFISTFTVFERNTYRDGVHIHSLINGINSSKAKLLQDKLTSSLGLSKVEAYDPSAGGNFYLCNKIYQNRLEDYQIYKINSAVR